MIGFRLRPSWRGIAARGAVHPITETAHHNWRPESSTSIVRPFTRSSVKRNLCTVTVLFMGFALSAKADPIPMSPELKAFLDRPEQQQALASMMRQQWRMAGENCSSPKLQGLLVLVETAPTFDSNGEPTSGEWRVVSHIEGCGEKRVFNLEYLFTPDGQMKRIALLPGTTAANLKLQHDALTYAAMGMAKIAPKECKDMKCTDTKFIGFDDTNSPAPSGKRPWTEEWTVRACGVTGIVTMHFTPDANATGVHILTELNKTRQVTP